MSDEFERYAIYWVPRRSDPISRFGVAWTGWCADQGELRPGDGIGGLTFDAQQVTRDLRRHGLHAAIRAPFPLGRGRSQFILERELETAIEGLVTLRLPRLALAVLDGRVTLVPREASRPLGELIARIDEAVAPIVSPEPARPVCRSARLVDDGPGLGDVIQFPASNLHRFHIPLTDQLADHDAFRIAREIRPLVAQHMETPRLLQDIALLGDPGGGRRLRVLQRYELRLTPPRRASAVLPAHGPEMLVPTGPAEMAV